MGSTSRGRGRDEVVEGSRVVRVTTVEVAVAATRGAGEGGGVRRVSCGAWHELTASV